MNNRFSRTVIIVASIIGIGIIALIVGAIIRSYHTITMKDENKVAASFYQIVNDKEVPIKVINRSESISVKDGQYCVKTTDISFDETPVCIKVDGKNQTLVFNPTFSTKHLSDLLTDSLVSKLQAIITTKYRPIIDQFTLDRGTLFAYGEWYATTLTVKTAPQDRGDVYRTILKKEGNTWKIVAPPQISINKYDYPNIPHEILSAVNLLPGNPS